MNPLLAAAAQIGPAPTSGATSTDSNTAVIVAAITTFGVVLAALISVFGLRTGKRLEAIEASVGGLSSDLGGRIDTLTARLEGAIDHLGDRIDAAVDRVGERIDGLYSRPPHVSPIEEELGDLSRQLAAQALEVARSLAAETRPAKKAVPTKATGSAKKIVRGTARSGRFVQKPDR